MKLLPILGMSTLFFSGAVLANSDYLILYITNATKQVASLAGADPKDRQVHGYIAHYGALDISPGKIIQWTFYMCCEGNMFSKGIDGKIEYQWKGAGEKNHFCLIHYGQTTNYFSVGINKTTVTGDCSVFNDPQRPEDESDMSGESQITLGVKE